MSVLTSLPRVSRPVGNALHVLKSACSGQVRQDTRTRAARALALALTKGSVSPLAVTHAMQTGEAGIAKLMRRHAVALPRLAPFVQSFTELCPEPFLPAEISHIKEILRLLAVAGHISGADIHALLDKSFDKSSATALIAAGFGRISQRVNQAMADAGFADPQIRQALSVVVVQDRVEVQCQEAFVLPCIASPESDPGFLAAYDGAITHVARHSAFMYPLTNGLEETEMYLAELIEDVKLRFGPVSSGDQIPDAFLEEAEEEYGYEPSYLRNTIPKYIQHVILREAIPAMEFGSPALDAWYADAPPKQVELIRKLHRLAEYANSISGRCQAGYSFDSDSYSPMLVFLDSNPVFLDMVIDRFSEMAFQEGMQSELIVENPSQFLECFEDALMNVAIANITLNLVEKYEHSID